MPDPQCKYNKFPPPIGTLKNNKLYKYDLLKFKF